MDLEDSINQSVRPADCKQGSQARLIPVMDWKETHLLGFFLSAFQTIPEFSQSVFSLIDAPKSKTQKVHCFTEVVFSSDKKNECRCDAVVEASRGTTRWRAIVEAKMGSASIEPDQIERYLRLAKDNKIDAVLTISNDFVSSPSESPVKVSGHLTRSVKLYHLSWWSLVTEALLIHHNSQNLSSAEKFILAELLRACLHPKAKIQGFTRMNSSWKDLVEKVQSGSAQKSDPDTFAAVSDWMQEQRELALIMSRFLGRHANLRIPNQHKEPANLRKFLTSQLVEKSELGCEIRIDDAASPIEVVSEINNRRHKFKMRLKAPEDRKSSKARLNWLLRQLVKAKDERIYVAGLWPGKTPPNHTKLSDLFKDSDEFLAFRPEAIPQGFEIALIDDLGGKYHQPKVFIERLEDSFLCFYKEVAVSLRAWQPPAPKPIVNQTVTGSEEAELD